MSRKRRHKANCREDELVQRTESSLMGRPRVDAVPLKAGDRVLFNGQEAVVAKLSGPPVVLPEIPMQVSAYNVATGKWVRR